MTDDHVDAQTVAANLVDARARIAAAGADPDAVRIVAVTKALGVEAVRAAIGAGITDIGENYAQELVAKVTELSREPVVPAAGFPGEPSWHFLGPVQRNKVAGLAPHVALWHAIDRPAALDAIAARSPGAAVLIQVNLAGDAGKSGAAEGDVASLVDHGRAAGIDVRGLMTVGPAGEPEAARPAFRRLAQLAGPLDLVELSMGMSGDFEVAVQEGATIVRLGTVLFGPRPGNARVRR